MELIAREFAEADNWGRGGFKIRQFDTFGSMYGFHVRGSHIYQTKLGAIFTIFYFVLVCATFAFYIARWADMSKPFVMWNQYKDKAYPEIDLWKENFHFYVLPIDLCYSRYIKWEDFWKSYHIYASIMDNSAHLTGTHQHWNNMPFEKCGDQDWAHALPDTDVLKEAIVESAICINPLKTVRTPLAQFTETLPIRGGTSVGSQRVFIDFYPCIPGGASPTTGIPTTCNDKKFGAALEMYIYDKTVNVKYYEQPVASAHVRTDILVPAKALRFEAAVKIKQVDLYTDVGKFAKDWEKVAVPSVSDFVKTSNESSLSNLTNNYMSQGKAFLIDYLYHLELATTNEKTEIFRYYFTVIDVFAAVGGL